MTAGPAYATRHLGFHIESDSLLAGGAPDDVLAGLCGLWDLFLGDDEQWLYTPFDLKGLVSFDHSLWLTRGEGDWNVEVLEKLVDTPNPFSDVLITLSSGARSKVAHSLRQLQPTTTLEIINSTPVQWYQDPAEPAALGWFIHQRLGGVARRTEEASQ